MAIATSEAGYLHSLSKKKMSDISRKYIESLDLQYLVDPILKKFKWDIFDAEESVRKYKNFLLLHLVYPDFKIVPSLSIDVVWHEHILHTKKYMEDCDKIYGVYFHHTPIEWNETEEEADPSAYIETARLYEKYFQEPYGRTFDISIWL